VELLGSQIAEITLEEKEADLFSAIAYENVSSSVLAPWLWA
jgi:hypothetical protein